MLKPLIAPLLALALAGPGLAQDAPPDLPLLSDLPRDPAMAAAFDAMAARDSLPDWLDDGLVETPTHEVGFDGKSWLAMTACKPHDCAAHRIAVLYDPKAGVMHGVVSDVEDSHERLTWLGMGGGAETIDGRTILYAALSGSLENHPGAFDYD